MANLFNVSARINKILDSILDGMFISPRYKPVDSTLLVPSVTAFDRLREFESRPKRQIRTPKPRKTYHGVLSLRLTDGSTLVWTSNLGHTKKYCRPYQKFLKWVYAARLDADTLTLNWNKADITNVRYGSILYWSLTLKTVRPKA